jgi:hypothetical protein
LIGDRRVATQGRGGDGASLQGFVFPPASPQFLDGGCDPAPDNAALQVAILEQLIGALGCLKRRSFPVLVDHQLCGAEDVGIVDLY